MTRAKNSAKSGIALFMVLVALALLSVIAIEIRYSSGVDARISRNLKERLQAQYLAQSAARLSMLRLYLYKEARNMVTPRGQGAMSSMLSPTVLNQAWSIPLPQMPFATMTDVVWPGVISSNIESEGSKIPINYIDGNLNRESSPELQKAITDQITSLIRGKLEDETFADRYRELNIAELIANLQDWIDADTNKQSGGQEADDYERLDYKPRDGRIPVLSEIHMIRGWNEELYNIIAKPHFSVINSSTAIDPNHISMERLRAMHPELSNEDLAAIEKRRFEQPFTSVAELVNFISTSPEVRGGRGFSFGSDAIEDKKVEDTFYINASGKVGETQRSYRIGVRFTYVKPPAAQNPGAGGQPSGGQPDTSRKETYQRSESEKEKVKFDKLYVVSVEELI